jgi:hypothetical protein
MYSKKDIYRIELPMNHINISGRDTWRFERLVPYCISIMKTIDFKVVFAIYYLTFNSLSAMRKEKFSLSLFGETDVVRPSDHAEKR